MCSSAGPKALLYVMFEHMMITLNNTYPFAEARECTVKILSSTGDEQADSPEFASLSVLSTC